MALAASCAGAQRATEPFTETGHIAAGGRSLAYVIRHLPPSSFPDLPAGIVQQLTQRGCLIPQTYEAQKPENVIHASLERAGSSDWAVLCSAHGTVSLLVFFANAPERPSTLASTQELERLQPHGAGTTLGFNWGIDAASPQTVHQAQAGLQRRPPAPDHDALADSVVDGHTAYHLFTKGHWTLLEVPE
jgi:hypothetical protein